MAQKSLSKSPEKSMGKGQTSSKPVERPPALHLSVGHLDIRVYPWGDVEADREDADGIYEVAKDSIYVRASRAPIEQFRILLHEILHVIWDTWGMGEAALTEEETCSKLDLGLANVFKDNPHLIDLMAAVVKEGKGIFDVQNSIAKPERRGRRKIQV